jgi:3-isopropylmalate/(R)-2-methylmalate dehydratase large subunit
MGHTKGEIFLGSPAADAVAALRGKFTDPAPYIDREMGR